MGFGRKYSRKCKQKCFIYSMWLTVFNPSEECLQKVEEKQKECKEISDARKSQRFWFGQRLWFPVMISWTALDFNSIESTFDLTDFTKQSNKLCKHSIIERISNQLATHVISIILNFQWYLYFIYCFYWL